MRYLVHAPSDGRYLGSAIAPGLTRPAGAWSSRGPIAGAPGTVGIPAPAPYVEQNNAGMASMGTSRSQDAPNIIFPALYFENSHPHEHAPVSRTSDNQMPVPAVRPANVIIAAPLKARKGGQRQVYQPQVIQKFPGLYGRTNG
jgi:hypothetical protein